MNRDAFIAQLKTSSDVWDVIIIGGGATGLGTAIDAASRGYRTLLLEQDDFGKGTSSRSTKLVHGGVRYLRQGNISLVLEGLRERGLLLKNAPHLVSDLTFIVPGYRWWQKPFYGIGLKLYDQLAGKRSMGDSLLLSREETLQHLPTLTPKGLYGSISYHDGQFDDTRMLVNMAQTVVDNGGVVLNYFKVQNLIKNNGKVVGVAVTDLEERENHEIHARVLVNATGIFSDGIRQMDNPDEHPSIVPSQGAHIVLDHSFMPGGSALMIPSTDDGRILFAIPWHQRILVGTTDVPMTQTPLEPLPMAQEIDFLLSHISRYLTKKPAADDILSVFAGLRPLVRKRMSKNTSSLSRTHEIIVSKSCLVTIIGGKWTTFRQMAEDTIDRAIKISDLPKRGCQTQDLHLHGWIENSSEESSEIWRMYGADAPEIKALEKDKPEWGKPIHPDLPYAFSQVIWAVRSEMARTVEDVLARRTRALLLDARASIEAAPAVAGMMAQELHKDNQWVEHQVTRFKKTAENYIMD